MMCHSIKQNIITHCGNNQKNNQMIMTAILHDVWSRAVDHLITITIYQQEV